MLQAGQPMAIGVLARATGFSVATIRYYEEIGLIPPAIRRPSGHRVYDARSKEQLLFIRRCRDLGFTLEQVKSLVNLSESDERSCQEARDIAQSHLTGVRAKLQELEGLAKDLEAYVQTCNVTCCDGPAKDCTIIEDLGAGTKPSNNRKCCG